MTEESNVLTATEFPEPTTLELWLGFRFTPEPPLTFAELLKNTSDWLWGMPLLYLLIGGGLFFTFYSRFTPFLYLWHGIQILRGKYNNPDDPGEINHFQALCSALSATVGMGNIAGVAVAITSGGPGALFWMWVCALVGMATKFFTCSLAIMYRGTDHAGKAQGGPMYFIVEGLGKRWKPLALAFCFFGMFGCLPLVQSNQLTAIVGDMFFIPNEWLTDEAGTVAPLGKAMFGLVMAVCVGSVILGGITRIGKVASRLVPFMVLLYAACAIFILITHIQNVPAALGLILSDAFSGEAVAGGALGAVISTGVRRAAFSNEAGMGTEAMAHGAAKTSEPIREGLVAMLGPMIDTLIVCTITGLIILSTGVWKEAGDDVNGALLTASAFTQGIPFGGSYLLLVCVLCFSFSSMIGFSYYVTKCGIFLFGPGARIPLIFFYLIGIVVSAVIELGDVINFLDIMFGMMAIPTMLSALLLSPRVMGRAREYFAALGQAR